MTSNPGRRARRAARYGHRQPTRMTEYQRNRQGEAPSGRLKVHAHLHDLDLNALAEHDEAGVFEAVACQVDGCAEAIEWNEDLEAWQHHSTRLVRCAGDRGVATPPELDEPDEDPDEWTPPEPRPGRDIDGNPYDTEFARGVLMGLQDKPTYQGSVHVDEVDRRRLRNRDAKRARRLMRRARVKRSRARRHGAA